MGNDFKKKKYIHKYCEIKDFSKVRLPNGDKMIKITTYHANLKRTDNLIKHIKDITKLVFGMYKSKESDIICIQGIHDVGSAKSLISSLDNYADKIYVAPNVDTRTDCRNSSRSNNLMKAKVRNIIISKHPILSAIYGTLSDENHNKFNNMMGIQSIVGVNIDIDVAVISVFCSELSKDISCVNIMNVDTRRSELVTISDIIKKNTASLYKDHIIHKPHCNFISLLSHIPESVDDAPNVEFMEMIQNHRFIDIHRHLIKRNDSDDRRNYIFFVMDENVSSIDMNKVKTSKDLIKMIMLKYGIYFLDIYGVSSLNNSDTIPIELVVAFKN